MDESAPESVQATLERCAQLFNAGEYHQAHELLDELWENASERDSNFFKGLIQAAIALHHLQAGNLEGARKLYLGHRQFLAPYLPTHRGLDLARFLAEMRAALAPAVEPGAPPAAPPRLEF